MSNGCAGCRNGLAFNSAFSMAFQPIVDLGAGRTYAQEALARGPNGEPAGTVLSQVTSENRYGFDQACRVLAIEKSAALGMRDTEALLSINFMPNAVYEPRACIRQTIAAAEKAGFPPQRLIFEFTEDEIIEPPHLLHILTAYREIGFLTAIDDFGSGYAGLSLLSKLQPDLVKVDMELIRGIDRDRVKQVMLKHLLGMLNDLGVRVVCEGIETVDELQVVLDMGVELVQGFLLAKPAFEALVEPDLSVIRATQ